MPPSRKERLDKLLVERGLCASRAQAQALIMEGRVRVDGQVVSKAGTLVDVVLADLSVREGLRYVSRGGLKLEKALAAFDVSPEGRVCIDVGASTGGFTDCLLQHGATRVIAVDVGYGQLDWRLRNDARVRVLEKTHIGRLSPELLGETPSLGVVDASFISLTKVLPPLAVLLAPEAEIVALLKPQFEYGEYGPPEGPSGRAFKGVVRQPGAHRHILAGVLDALDVRLPDWACLALDASPITGPKGNIEFLVFYGRASHTLSSLTAERRQARIAEVVAAAHADIREDHSSGEG
jgi:23S rRNA (cytidine1920-2'-O)/16S rRNA (cytidine1409-2'-O)-methyltransferase